MKKKERPFEGILGNSIELRILDHLLSVPRLNFSVTELKRITGISRTSVDKVVKNFVELEILRQIGYRGNMPLYELNEKSPYVEAAYSFNDAIMERVAPQLCLGSMVITPQTIRIEEEKISENENWKWTDTEDREAICPIIPVATKSKTARRRETAV